MNSNFSILATILFVSVNLFPIRSSTPLNCTETNRVCTSFLAFKPPKNNNPHVTQQTLTLIGSMFDVLGADVFFDRENDLVFVRKNCSCASPSMKYLTNTTFTVRRSGGSVGDEVREAYKGLEYVEGGSARRGARVGAVVSLHLMCGCSSGLWNYLMSYVVEEGDSVEGLASRFGVSMDSIEAANGIDGPGNVTAGEVYYIPLNSVPGEPYHLEEEISPTPAPEPSVVESLEGINENHKDHLPYGWILGSIGAGLFLIICCVLVFAFSKFSFCCIHTRGNLEKDSDGKISHKFHILGRSSFCCASEKSTVCSKGRDWRPNNGESSNRHISIPTERNSISNAVGPIFTVYSLLIENVFYLPTFFNQISISGHGSSHIYVGIAVISLLKFSKLIFYPPTSKLCYPDSGVGVGYGYVSRAVGTDVFEMDKPVIFTYEEILYSTDGFSDSNLLGHGTYGSVYYGILRDQVAIKRMTATKTKEFMAEMRVLCKVHHANLVELIGYAASDDELFLIYECAQKGSLRSHLHDPHNKGNTSLSWNVRVQIALDAARGLEYIHEHTKAHYVHRDIKTSNILLDSAFRAKISDFGLAKLVGKIGDGEASATKVVGTFGYLAPEYLSNGLATRKSDVYAFGVVLFELISGKEAITQTDGMALKNSERRSLASVMIAALRSSPNSMSMTSLKECIDPNLMDLYPHDCVHKMAMLAKQCADEDPILRPDMKQVVITLSQILLSSVEWEATLAGNSQVFSGLVQGR
ncbi:hypothetical protein Sjap_011570 [Stephania japonica]|uniref:LysM domain receptor-like kinase 3 n=1 Tax=Stephania japonica TaxID=461633 RepID=A0AAP0JBS3_9MAGN